MQFDPKRLNRGELVAAVGAVLSFVFLFIGWYEVGGAVGDAAEQFGIDNSISGWDAHSLLRWLILLTVVAALGLAFLKATGRAVPRLAVSTSALVAALGALTTILIAFRMLIAQPGPDKMVDVKFGAWLALASMLVVTVGGWLAMQAEGLSVKAAGEQFRTAVESVTESKEEPPPPQAPTAPYN